MIRFVEATEDHAAEVAANLRLMDVLESAALLGTTGVEAVWHSMAAPGKVYAAEHSYGTTVALFGVSRTTVLGNIGSPWLLGTDRVDEHTAVMLDVSRRFVAHKLKRFEELRNVVWERNRKSQVYLRRVGFTLGDVKINHLGEPFREFTMRRQDV